MQVILSNIPGIVHGLFIVMGTLLVIASILHGLAFLWLGLYRLLSRTFPISEKDG